ncbi:DUF7196 family protein [Streptomyces sp. bgisy084]|uniref:DUF7196 family protein n=1 Tax=unclassified Streptomyces TaxID=2593676 RepID=UPI003D7134C9
MGCNCGGGARTGVTLYQLTLPDGTVRLFYTWQEAEAANQRAGGIGTITVITQ